MRKASDCRYCQPVSKLGLRALSTRQLVWWCASLRSNPTPSNTSLWELPQALATWFDNWTLDISLQTLLTDLFGGSQEIIQTCFRTQAADLQQSHGYFNPTGIRVPKSKKQLNIPCQVSLLAFPVCNESSATQALHSKNAVNI